MWYSQSPTWGFYIIPSQCIPNDNPLLGVIDDWVYHGVDSMNYNMPTHMPTHPVIMAWFSQAPPTIDFSWFRYIYPKPCCRPAEQDQLPCHRLLINLGCQCIPSFSWPNEPNPIFAFSQVKTAPASRVWSKTIVCFVAKWCSFFGIMGFFVREFLNPITVITCQLAAPNWIQWGGPMGTRLRRPAYVLPTPFGIVPAMGARWPSASPAVSVPGRARLCSSGCAWIFGGEHSPYW